MRGVNRPTDRRIFGNILARISDSALHFNGFWDLTIPADCGFILLFGPDNGILPVIKFGSRISTISFGSRNSQIYLLANIEQIWM